MKKIIKYIWILQLNIIIRYKVNCLLLGLVNAILYYMLMNLNIYLFFKLKKINHGGNKILTN